jgi:L-threonylcarbamoyladenylate synthase
VNWPVPVDNKSLGHATDLLRAGGVVAFPTETYYGLAVDPFNPAALDRLFRVKHRPSRLPILVLVGRRSQLPLLTSEVPSLYQRLMENFWPGPLTLIFPALPTLPHQLTGQTGTVGIRHSPHQVANALIDAFNSPITATSANISGYPAASSAEDVARMFGDDLDLVLDGGLTPGGKGSTLVGMEQNQLVCIRDGQIDYTEVQLFVNHA